MQKNATCKIVGLTGGIASGKGSAADLFAIKGILTVDADDISRRLSTENSPAGEKIIKHFGDIIVGSQGGIDRHALRKIIFDNPKERRWLEGLLHPLIREELVQELEKRNKPDYSFPYCLLVSPLLLETSQYCLCDKIILLDITQQNQVQRAVLRDNMDKKMALQIIGSQMAQNKKCAKVDYLLDNNQNRQHLAQQVDILHQKLLKLYK